MNFYSNKIKNIFRKIIESLPLSISYMIRKFFFYNQLKSNNFLSSEIEYFHLEKWIKSSDWVIDIGANIGRYTQKFSILVGKDGRVLSFEPMLSSFSLLSELVYLNNLPNVTLFNIALSDKFESIGIQSPPLLNVIFDTNTQAQLTREDSEHKILAFPADAFNFSHKINFIKIDTEGYELNVIKGMKNLIIRDYPTFLIEDNVSEVNKILTSLGYKSIKFPNSRNTIFIK
jgi:FkbM family methyltransferase